MLLRDCCIRAIPGSSRSVHTRMPNVRAARWHRVGPDRSGQIVAHFRLVRSSMEPYYHRLGWAFAGADDAPPPVPRDAAGEPADFADPFNGSKSSPVAGTFSKPLTNPDSVTDVDFLFAGLGLEPAAFVRLIGCSRSGYVSFSRNTPARALYQKRTPPCSLPEPWTASQFQNSSNAMISGDIPAALADPARQLPVFIELADQRHRQFGVQRAWRRRPPSDSATVCHSWRRTRGRRISTMFRRST